MKINDKVIATIAKREYKGTITKTQTYSTEPRKYYLIEGLDIKLWLPSTVLIIDKQLTRNDKLNELFKRR